jgi:two-component system NtrC family sensor kinase
MPTSFLRRPWARLWVKLAVFAALGVVVTHTVHLTISNRITSYALTREQENRGRSVARLVANRATEALLVDDRISLHELVTGVVSKGIVAYCFVVRSGLVLASSFPTTPPRALIDVRGPGDVAPLVVVSAQTRYLDLVEPILDGNAGVVRVGLDMGSVQSTIHRIALLLGMVALAIILAGVLAAFVVGRSIARPVGELVAAADRFDPSADARLVESRSSDEIGELAERFNRMMVRLKAAHDEQSRARQKEVETERMAALGSLVAGVAHEVNNPLAGLKNCLRRLQRDDLLPPEKRQEYLELMEEGLERIEEAMRQLLDYARPRPLKLDHVSVSDLVHEGTSLVRPSLARRQIELRADDAVSTRVVADRKQIVQGLLNLLLNAAHVTPDGGEIRVRVRERPGQCGIAVEDDGPGIPLDIRDHILDPFFSTKPEGEGTGLGLSVTKSLVDAHSGELTMEFPERGTTATIWLQLASAGAAAGLVAKGS